MATWRDPQPIHVPDELRQVVARAGAHGELVAELLARRGILDAATARGFLDVTAYVSAPPEALPDVLAVVERLERAIATGERIAVWGDFDVDGQTATALYLQALRDLGADVTFRIPTRRESHGVHPVGVQRLVDAGVRLLLTADTGVDAHRAIDLAQGQGVDVLVTDHHDLPTALPDPLALVNPRRLSPEHPLYGLPGVGVAYQVVRALYRSAGRDVPDLLDLVALGIVADVATLRADVRYLLQLGLEVLRRAARPGLRAMLELARLDQALLSEEDISFALAPRLNALSRVGGDLDTSAGVELLTTADLTRARTIATALEALNARRRWLTRETTDAALSQLERERALLDGPAVVVAGARWDPGIVGIVAGRLAQRYNKPAVVLSAPDGDLARGSARSIEGIDIHAAIAAQRHMLHRCGGHPMAAGLSLEGDRIPAFRQALWRTLAETAPPPAEPEVQIDAYLTLDRLSIDLVEAVNQLAPFGPGNERPVFATRDLGLASSAVIGRTREHRRTVVRDAEERQQVVMWWQSADQPAPEGRFDLAYTLSISAFRGERNVQLAWLDARSLAPPPAVEVIARPTRVVRDYRHVGVPQTVLRGLLSEVTGAPERVIVWAEVAALPDGIATYDRTALREAETLVVWTIPPDPVELEAALATVSPREVVLFGEDPGLDVLQPFLHRLGGLVVHVLRARGGRVPLIELAAHTAHSTWTVRLGLLWMAQKGQVGIVSLGREGAVLCPGSGQEGERLQLVQAQLQAQLEETAAYRSYYLNADAGRLVGGELQDT